MNKGYFIVIDGTDGSGKSTQVQLLKDSLELRGINCQVLDFPRYQGNIYGELVGRYLKGEFGQVDQVSPYLGSLAFAGDRLLAKPLIEKWLKEKKIVLANRYVPSNKAHMSAKLPESHRQKFIDWVDKLEYETNKIPREDLVIFLYVSPNLSQRNIDKKSRRQYIGGKKRDIHEASFDHLSTSSTIYLHLSQTEPHWIVVDCVKGGKMKSREQIHKQILLTLKERGVI